MKVDSVRSDSSRLGTNTGGWRVRWKQWTKIPKSYSLMLESIFSGRAKCIERDI